MATETSTVEQTAEREKQQVAFSSVLAAIGLTTFKIVVGIMTGSLGILSEAAHSGLDLVAALVTLFAVRVSDKPADEQHHYGHGKVENFSALIETLLLLVTCVWIIYEATKRLFFEDVGPSGIYNHSLIGNFEHHTYKCVINKKREELKRSNLPLYNFFFEEYHPNIIVD